MSVQLQEKNINQKVNCSNIPLMQFQKSKNKGIRLTSIEEQEPLDKKTIITYLISLVSSIIITDLSKQKRFEHKALKLKSASSFPFK